MHDTQNIPAEPSNDTTPNPAVEAPEAAPVVLQTDPEVQPPEQAEAESALDAPVVAAEAEPSADAPVDPADGTVTAAVAAPPAAPAIPDMSPIAVAHKLAELFPPLFGAGRALPIKLRIQADIQQRAPGLFNKKSLSIFLHRATTSTAYLRALSQMPARLDLDGQPAGDIAQEHRDAAAVELTRRMAIVQERRVAERQAQQQRHPAAQSSAAADGTAAAIGPEGAAAAQAAPVGERPARADRPPRTDRAPRGDRPPRPDRPGPRPPRPEGAEGAQARRDPRPAGPRQDPRAGPRPHPRDQVPVAPQGDRQPRPPRPQRPDASVQAAAEPAAPRVPLTPEQAAEQEVRRSRANVLRAFETTTLTRSNFCALKGMTDAALEAVLVQARADRGERGERAERTDAAPQRPHRGASR